MLDELAAITPLASSLFQSLQSRKQYDKMLAYNHPKAQMQRFKEAGLSPYLAYGQASSGNADSPRPNVDINGQQGIENYMAMKNFDADMRIKNMQRNLMLTQNSKMHHEENAAMIDSIRKELELYADFPEYIKGQFEYGEGYNVNTAQGSYRQKMNELKTAIAEGTLQNMMESLQNLRYKNVVDSVRAGYAKDYGMVGGDWTQGLGLVKSFAQGFLRRSPAKSIHHTYQRSR